MSFFFVGNFPHLSWNRNDELDMRGMTEDDLMTLCALSGCDYLPSVHGVGLKKAHRLVARHKQVAQDTSVASPAVTTTIVVVRGCCSRERSNQMAYSALCPAQAFFY